MLSTQKTQLDCAKNCMQGFFFFFCNHLNVHQEKKVKVKSTLHVWMNDANLSPLSMVTPPQNINLHKIWPKPHTSYRRLQKGRAIDHEWSRVRTPLLPTWHQQEVPIQPSSAPDWSQGKCRAWFSMFAATPHNTPLGVFPIHLLC